jgi:CDP-diacylglycerol--glycerol-3-phosphate 3-phosphatidyltransferase
MKLKKNIANIITISRIIFSLLMLLFPAFSIGFWILYSLSGLSDFIDGIVARKLEIESKTGAILDSISDMVFFIVLIYFLLSKVSLPVWLIISIASIAFVRLLAYLISLIKFRCFVSLHTYLNKLTGLLLFFSPLMFYFWGLQVTGIILVSIASVSSLEEMLIDIFSNEINRDRKSLFIK